MFASYDLMEFGQEMKKIRKNIGFTQNDVKNTIGVNEDTLRRIEKGEVIPRYETLELLSALYKKDLLTTLQYYRSDADIRKYYSLVDKVILNNEKVLLKKIHTDFELHQSTYKTDCNLIHPRELDQFEHFLVGLQLYNSELSNERLLAEDEFVKALRCTIPSFDSFKIESNKYNYFEMRLLLLIGLSKAEKNEFNASSDILKYILNYMLNLNSDDFESTSLKLKLYTNISYNYHMIDKHDLALQYAEDGILLSRNSAIMHGLFLLLYRKGIAQYYLGIDQHRDTITKSVQLIEILGQHDLAELYRKITLEKYGLTV